MSEFIAALLIKVSFIFAAGIAIRAVIRSAPAAVRHLVLLATLVCALTLPAVMLLTPRWDVHVLPVPTTAWYVPTAASPRQTGSHHCLRYSAAHA